MVFPSNCKFAVLAVHNVRVDVVPDLILRDGTRVLTKFPFALENHWRTWLGSMQSERLQSCNLFLLRTATSGWDNGQLAIFGGEVDSRLMDEVGGVFAFLRLVGTIEYEDAFVLAGHVEETKATCRHFATTEHFNITSGCTPWVIRQHDLESAAELRSNYASLLKKFPDRWRFGRGCNALKTAFERHYASDRLHGFVRALEALIVPEIGRTEKQFVSRCSLFAGPKSRESEIRSMLQEVYRMRCDIEHVHDWDRSLDAYPIPDRENIALWRTRQMEELASAAYRKILLDPTLQLNFRDDSTIENFWKRTGDEVRAALGTVCDISELRLVKKYDSFGRADPSEWPRDLFEKLIRMAKSA